jgi:hypothetical protein
MVEFKLFKILQIESELSLNELTHLALLKNPAVLLREIKVKKL